MGNTFRRVESKYILNKEQFEILKNAIQEYMVEDEYGKSTIRNIYFDTENYDLISNSITKPYVKEKVRMRCYNKPNKNSMAFIEIKRKCEGVVGKRRIQMKYYDVKNYLKDRNNFRCENKQIKTELDYYFELYKLEPKMYVSYSREAYYKKDDRDFRVTFDSNVIARSYDLSLESDNYGTNILPLDKYIMEIKTLGCIPLWFVKILNELNLAPCGFSKYGESYTQLILKANDAERCVV